MRIRTALAAALLAASSIAAIPGIPAAAEAPASAPAAAATRKVVKTKPYGVTDTNPDKCVIDWQTQTGGAKGTAIVTYYWRYYYPGCAYNPSVAGLTGSFATPSGCSTKSYGNAGEALCTSGSGQYRVKVGCRTAWSVNVGETKYGTYRTAGQREASLAFCDSSHPYVRTVAVSS